MSFQDILSTKKKQKGNTQRKHTLYKGVALQLLAKLTALPWRGLCRMTVALVNQACDIVRLYVEIRDSAYVQNDLCL